MYKLSIINIIPSYPYFMIAECINLN